MRLRLFGVALISAVSFMFESPEFTFLGAKAVLLSTKDSDYAETLSQTKAQSKEYDILDPMIAAQIETSLVGHALAALDKAKEIRFS